MRACMHECVRACVCAWVRAWNERDKTPGSEDSSFLQTLFGYSIYLKANTSFRSLGKVTDWETPFCVYWEDIFRCGDEVMYGWVQVRRLYVVNSRHLVLAKITPKITQNTRKCCLQRVNNVRFSNFGGWYRNWKPHFAQFLSESVKKSAQSIPDSCQKA